MAGSIERVMEAAKEVGLEIEVKRMGASTRTSEEAASQCGCDVAQIMKSLIFQAETSDRLYLFLLQGSSQLDLVKAEALTGEKLKRADPRLIRERTGFAIGGVSPIGHTARVPAYAEEALLQHEIVWAAAGAHDVVFSAEPRMLLAAAKAMIADIAK